MGLSPYFLMKTLYLGLIPTGVLCFEEKGGKPFNIEFYLTGSRVRKGRKFPSK
jgi:hypothetical protein